MNRFGHSRKSRDLNLYPTHPTSSHFLGTNLGLRLSRKFHTAHCGSHFRGKMHEFLALQDDHSPTRSTIPEAIGYVLPLVSVCCQVFNFKPHKKNYNQNDIPFVWKKFQKLSSYLSGKSRTKCKWWKIAKKTEAIHPSYCRHATDTRLFASRPHLFHHLSHQIPKMRNSQ